MNERDLIERLVISDPVFNEAYEGFHDCCVFCNVSPRTPPGAHPDKQLHKPDCAWIAGMRYLGRSFDERHAVHDGPFEESAAPYDALPA